MTDSKLKIIKKRIDQVGVFDEPQGDVVGRGREIHHPEDKATPPAHNRQDRILGGHPTEILGPYDQPDEENHILGDHGGPELHHESKAVGAAAKVAGGAARAAGSAAGRLLTDKSGGPWVPGLEADNKVVDSHLDGDQEDKGWVAGSLDKEGGGGDGGGIAGAGDSMVGSDVHTPVGGSHRKRETYKGVPVIKKSVTSDHYLLQADASHLIRTLPERSIDCVITSPPYWQGGAGTALSLEKTVEEYAQNLALMLEPLKKALKEDGYLWLVIGEGRHQGSQAPSLVRYALVKSGWFEHGCHWWDKEPGVRDYIWQLSPSKTRTREAEPIRIKDPVETYRGSGFRSFPVSLAKTIIKDWCPQDGTVLDPFMGTGTTAVAALQLGRRVIGSDISATEVQIAEQRVKLQKAVATDPAQYDLKILNKQFTGKVHPNRFVVAGYASPVMVDLEGHKITREALERDLPRFMANQGAYANVNVLHSNVTVGRILPSYTDELGNVYRTQVDDVGLFVVAEVRTDPDAPAVCHQVIKDIESGELRSFSISGNAENPTFTCDGERCFYSINDLQLYEITICKEGVNPEAKFDVIAKSLDRRGTLRRIKLIRKRSPQDMKEESLGEEMMAVRDYGQRSQASHQEGDHEAAELFHEIAQDERHHIAELNKDDTKDAYSYPNPAADAASLAREYAVEEYEKPKKKPGVSQLGQV